MAIKTISQFDAATPTSSDKILFEQNGEGKSTTIGDAVNTCSLSYEEIMASTDPSDLSGKVASADALLRRTVVATEYNVTYSSSTYASPFACSGVLHTDINYLDVIGVYSEDTPNAYSMQNNNGKSTIIVYGNKDVINTTRRVLVSHFK